MKKLEIPARISEYKYYVSEMDIWSHYECELLHNAGMANPLDEFIYHNEPAGDEDSNKFRQSLIHFLITLLLVSG